MNEFICRNPQCDGKGRHCAKGLCHRCYMSKQQSVTKGDDTWDSLKFRRPGKLGRPSNFSNNLCEFEGCQQKQNTASSEMVNGVYPPVLLDGKKYCPMHYNEEFEAKK